MSQALHLHRLQLVDTRIDQNKARLKTIQKTLSEDSLHRTAQLQFDKAKTALAEAGKRLKQCEAEVETQNIHIQQEEASLYGGLVKNPKELKDLQDELSALRRRLAVLEDHELDAMVAVDDRQKEFIQAEAHMTAVEQQVASQHSDLFVERSQLDKYNEKLLSERSAILAIASPDSLKVYERLRIQRGGNAVVEVIDKSCSACGATLTPAEWQAARSPDRLSFCPSCNRILYAG
jgi:predicted  nucleic acid-binding Zn-ribbon protein